MDNNHLGSFGSVCMCRDKKTKGIYAIKFLHIKDPDKGKHEKKSLGKSELSSIVNEINIMRESIECPYVVE